MCYPFSPCEMEGIDSTIKLAGKSSISSMGIVRDVEILCGKTQYLTCLLVLGTPDDKLSLCCPKS